MKYLVNKKNKKIFNGVIPRYEKLKIYSTKEEVVGYFQQQDGKYKPLYRKCLYFPQSNQVKNLGKFDTEVKNIDFLNIEEANYSLNGSYIPMNFNLGGTNYLRLNMSNKSSGIFEVQASDNFNEGTLRDVIIVIKYTKTTDEQFIIK